MAPSDPRFDKLLFAKYASKTNPKELSPDIYFDHTERTLTIQEQYPKSIFHLIIMPRVGLPPRVQGNLRDLATFLTSPEVSKHEAKELLRELYEDAQKIRVEIEKEMIDGYGFKWDIWMGFKVAPSYRFLHMHIMSNDMNGTGLKNPSHFFSFHPKGDEFVHLENVLEWFDAVDTMYEDNVKKLRTKQKILFNQKAMGTYIDLEEKPVYSCYHKEDRDCLFESKDLPTMKAHLEEHFNTQSEKERKRRERREAAQKKIDNRTRRLAKEKEREANMQRDTEAHE